MLRKTGRV
jgi:hypothetical protein